MPAVSFEIAVNDIMPGFGWYAAEQEESAGRWPGPQRYFTIALPLRPVASVNVVEIAV